MKQEDISEIIKQFQQDNNSEKRYSSFDYCYNYFFSKTKEEILNDIEKSCLVLGFYLASWGMLRGSSFLLNKSIRYYYKTIEYISNQDKSVWDIDVNNYDEKNIEIIIEIYNGIKNNLIENKNYDVTLISKVLLGVFGFIPAFDQFFCLTFRSINFNNCGFRKVNKKSLLLIKDFYEANKIEIDELNNMIHTYDFITGNESKIKYPRAKIIDMYGFTKGINLKKK